MTHGALVLVALMTLSCGGIVDGEIDSQGAGPGADGVGTTTGSGDEGASGNPTGVVDSSGATGSSESSGADCALTLMLLLDRSTSMGVRHPTVRPDLWTPATAAIDAFLDHHGDVTLEVGAQFYPLPIDTGSSCKAEDYEVPVVPIGPIREVAPVIHDESSRHAPRYGAGTGEAAVTGTLSYLDSWQSRNPSRKVVSVLATDSDSAICGPLNVLGGSWRYVLTFGRIPELEDITRSGGATILPVDVTSAETVESSVEAALVSIVDAESDCR